MSFFKNIKFYDWIIEAERELAQDLWVHFLTRLNSPDSLCYLEPIGSKVDWYKILVSPFGSGTVPYLSLAAKSNGSKITWITGLDYLG